MKKKKMVVASLLTQKTTAHSIFHAVHFTRSFPATSITSTLSIFLPSPNFQKLRKTTTQSKEH